MTHGRAVPALAYRFDTADGSVVFSGDTTVNDDLIALAQGADILVHEVADLGYLERHGITGAALERMAALHTDVTEVGGVAERARVRELILSHYLPAEPDAITDANGQNAPGRASRDNHRRQRRPAQGAPSRYFVIISRIDVLDHDGGEPGLRGSRLGQQLGRAVISAAIRAPAVAVAALTGSFPQELQPHPGVDGLLAKGSRTKAFPARTGRRPPGSPAG